MTNGTPQPLKKLQRLFRDMFRSDRSDLNFGIYRIMNHRRDAVEEYIQETLPMSIMAELKKEYMRKEQASDVLREVARRVQDTLGPDAIGSDGQLAVEFRDTPLGNEYREVQRLAADVGDPSEIETDIYNHLYGFFSRYYQDGDFISRRRYSSGRHRYAIPYNGEEVYLHWANSDQYYVKTAEFFRYYDWEDPAGMQVRFEIRKADTEHNNIKAAKRLFLPLVDRMRWDANDMAAVIPFEYRPLTSREAEKYGRSNQQGKIVSAAVGDITYKLTQLAPDLAAALLRKRGRSDGGFANNLEQHLDRYTRRNAFDFFIHKDLKGFLSRELDFYLKSEVLNLDHVDRAGESNAGGWFQKMRLVKSVGGDIIDFLAQIEDFQKMLWEKRKFVTETNYCISVRCIDPKFYDTIANNNEQWEEWQQLLDVGNVTDRTNFILKHQALMIDTKHFKQDFVDCMLANFDNLDEFTDGLLVHSENWQALNLLLGKYRQQVMCTYIDPPYNSKTSEILYKNDYKHSSWLSLIDARLGISRQLATADGSHVIAIDENEQVFLGQLLMHHFPDHKNICVTIIHNKKGIQGDYLSYNHDFAYFCIPPALSKASGKKIPEAEWKYTNLRKWGGESERFTAKNCFYPIFVQNGKIVGFGDVCDDVFHPGQSNITTPHDSPRNDTVAVYPVDSKGIERKWRYARSSIESIKNLLKVKTARSGEVQIYKAVNESTFKTVWDDPKYIAGDHGTRWLTNLGLKEAGIDLYPKSLYTVLDSIHILTDDNSLILDYFAGSGTTGHAVINLNREDGGQRKFILVEMGEYFDTVLLPRIKKVSYASKWKVGKPENVASAEETERGPRIIKYVRLESYEDALDNIEFTGGAQMTLEGDYLLKYMLRWETRCSATLLNVEKLTRPFSYALRVRSDGRTRTKTVDIPETFNHVLGLSVRSRRAYHDNGSRYLICRGETRDRPGRAVAVIWRETAGWSKADFERDKAFVKKHGLAVGSGATYVNGGSLIPGARPVEELFRAKMFAGAGA